MRIRSTQNCEATVTAYPRAVKLKAIFVIKRMGVEDRISPFPGTPGAGTRLRVRGGGNARAFGQLELNQWCNNSGEAPED